MTYPQRKASHSRSAAMTVRGSHANCRRGLTLMEMMVSLAVLVMIMLAFNAILSQSQRVVVTSQNMTGANAQAMAISQVLRQDLSSITRDGFLAIVGPTNESPPTPQAIIFTATGTYDSRTFPNTTANAAVVCYSIREDAGRKLIPDILCREANLLAMTGGAGVWEQDVMNVYLSDIGAHTREEISTDVLADLADNYSPSAYYPVNSRPAGLEDVLASWRLLGANCTRFSVQWLASDDNWYGPKADGSDEYDSFAPSPGGSADIETDIETLRDTDAYMALWSWHDKTNWPRAVKIRFTISERDYEVICEIGG